MYPSHSKLKFQKIMKQPSFSGWPSCFSLSSVWAVSLSKMSGIFSRASDPVQNVRSCKSHHLMLRMPSMCSTSPRQCHNDCIFSTAVINEVYVLLKSSVADELCRASSLPGLGMLRQLSGSMRGLKMSFTCVSAS